MVTESWCFKFMAHHGRYQCTCGLSKFCGWPIFVRMARDCLPCSRLVGCRLLRPPPPPPPPPIILPFLHFHSFVSPTGSSASSGCLSAGLLFLRRCLLLRKPASHPLHRRNHRVLASSCTVGGSPPGARHRPLPFHPCLVHRPPHRRPPPHRPQDLRPPAAMSIASPRPGYW